MRTILKLGARGARGCPGMLGEAEHPHPGAPHMPLTLTRSLRTFRMRKENADLQDQ